MRYLCIHGHFYQPPRENAWLEAIEQQDSAYPYHDWNERITSECYAPNGASRILDAENCIDKIVNNYASINFNFGPTLLSCLAEKAPEPYRAAQACGLPGTRGERETPDIMAQLGSRYGVIAPSQAKSVDGEDVSGGRID